MTALGWTEAGGEIVELADARGKARYERRIHHELVGPRRAGMGRSRVTLVCPFCDGEVVAYLWSLAGSGKRCPCGAKFSGHGWSYKRVAP